ncbi:MAG TPA: c-type cytochrome [Candidatus Limnocylindria bacterium]|nr:c-type cytochrome [Candidatus Limnocylindria bacterium]
MRFPVLSFLLASLGLAFSVCAEDSAAPPPEVAASLNRGRVFYVANCSVCHQITGRGTKGTYPPLAGSDWLAANRREAIRAVVGGLNWPITVNGQSYHGAMPAQVLTDAQVADVLTYVLNSWGNPGGKIVAAEVGAVRATTDFKTFEALKQASDFKPLPPAPAGFDLAEVARLPEFATRLASDGKGGKLYVLGQGGTVWRLDLGTKKLKQILWPTNYPGLKNADLQTLGMALDTKQRLWITFNQRVDSRPLVTNEVGIFRTSALDAEGDPISPQPWFRTNYPYGIGPYNHGISDIRFGPDGLLYVSSGSRTDGGETGDAPNLGKMGEVDITSSVWRFDPQATEPKLEVIARGIRNAYSLGWNGSGQLFTVANGPDAHAPEEMDFITPRKPGEAPEHHGFPYQFTDAPADRKWYPYTPEAPAGVKFIGPVINSGPAALLGGKATGTFTPHSSPAGLVWLDGTWPESVRNSFLVGRFGNLIPGVNNDDTGFDLLNLKMLQRAPELWTATTTTFLAPLARPIDVHVAGHKIYVLEYTRPTDFKGKLGWLPGRILALTPRPESR